MSDDFERALLITFDYSGGVQGDLKERANAFVKDVKSNPEVWRLCCERFSSSTYTEIKFWCLQTLQEVIRKSYSTFHEAARTEVKTALLTWIQRDCAQLKGAGGLPSFLRNKLAQTLVAVLQFEYPSAWPTFFQDLIGALAQGEGIVDMFCRILVAVDEDIVSLDIPRSQDESKLSMHIKDSMREHAMSDVAEAWFRLVGAYHVSSPDLAASVLQTMQRYVPWIDINLAASPKFVALMLALLDSPHAGFQSAAADCLSEVVSKRMDAVPKLTLIEGMGIVPRCSQWSSGFPMMGTAAATMVARGSGGGTVSGRNDDDDDALLLRLARLLATLATEIIDSLKRLENGIISMAAIGLTVDDEAAVEVRSASELGDRQMAALFPALLSAFRSGVDEVALPLMPFMHAYAARLKVQQKRNLGVLPPEALGHVRAILEGLAITSRYPVESDCADGYSSLPAPTPSGIAAAREEQSDVEEKRRDLFSLFKNLSKIVFPEALAFVTAQLQLVTSPAPPGHPSATFQAVEIAVVLLYELGEGAPEEALKPDSGALGQLAVALMQANLPCARHRLVALAVLETYVRYSRVLQHHQAAIPLALTTFLDERGMGHPSEDVSTRSCYLFSRLSKLLRLNLRQFVPTILQSLQPHLARIATRPVADLALAATSSSAGGGSGGGSGTGRDIGAQRAGASLVDDRLYVFEAVGLLLGQEEIAAEEQQAMLSALLQPLREQIETHLNARGASSPGLILQALEAVVRLNKGFKTDLCTRIRPQLGRMFIHCLEVAIQVPRVYPSNKVLRSRFISCVHRMVECLGASLLPMLPAALEVLITTQVDVSDVTEVLLLTNQLVLKFKEAMSGLLQGLLPVLVTRLHVVLSADWDWSGKLALAAASAAAATSGPAVSLEEARERGELQRTYYTLLHVMVHTGLSSSLLKVPPGVLDAAIKAVTQGAGVHVDALVRRSCMQVIERLIADWCATPAAPTSPSPPGGSDGGAGPTSPSGQRAMAPEAVPGFRRFAIEHFAGEACVSGLLRAAAGGLFDVRDSATISLLGEAAMSLKIVLSNCGADALLSHLCTNVLPGMGLPPELQQQIAYHVRESEAKELKECLKTVMVWVTAQNQAERGALTTAMSR